MIAVHPLKVWGCDITLIKVHWKNGNIRMFEGGLNGSRLPRVDVHEFGRRERTPKLFDFIGLVEHRCQYATDFTRLRRIIHVFKLLCSRPMHPVSWMPA